MSLSKPKTCENCSLYNKGIGFAPASGPEDAEILIVGEALGSEEVKKSEAFVGPAGYLLNKALRAVGINRDEVRFHNVTNCQPTVKNWLIGAPWERSAIDHCSQYINKTLADGNFKVIIAVGSTAAKQLLGLYGTKGVSIFDLHGAPARDKTGKYWVIPTFHTSYLLQGHYNLFGVLCFDLTRALEIARNGFSGDKPNLIIDPGWAKFDIWVRETIQKAEQAYKNGIWLAADIETPYKRKNVKEENSSIGINPLDTIHRLNFAIDKDEAITVPFDAQHLEGIKALLAHPKLKKAFWNMNFDKPNLEAAGVPVLEPCADMMYAWHMLQSDVRMGLGFVAPFYSMYGPWKHLTDHTVPVENLYGIAADNYKVYSAIDAIQTIRCTFGIEKDLKSIKLWDIFERHVRDLDRFALRSAEKIGLLFNKTKLEKFQKELEIEEIKVGAICEKFAPKSIIPWDNEWKTSKASMDELGKLKPGYFEITEKTMCYVCENCQTVNVNKTHSKTKKCNGAQLNFQEHIVTKWVKEGKFNPNSPKQVLSYIKSQGHKPGKQKKSDNETSDVGTLESLKKKHPKDPMYPALLKVRKVTKMKGTYCDGILKRMDYKNRIHATFNHIPSTLRLGCKNPNLMNLVAKDKKEDEDEYGKKFRECVIASPGCILVEFDFGAVESIQTGWFAKDPEYIRLSKLSVHSYLASHIVGKPADLAWSNEELKTYFSEIKDNHFVDYNKAKRVVHSASYGMTAYGLHMTYPELFPKTKDAKKIQDTFFSVAEKMRKWQLAMVKKADEQGYLGGSDHPFNYKHYYHKIIEYTKITKQQAFMFNNKNIQTIQSKDGTHYQVKYGVDANRAMCFYPQSTGSAILKEAMLALFDPDASDYIGDAYYGETPLRAPIHDSLLLEVPMKKLDFVVERVYKVMTSPIKQQPMDPSWNMGEFLQIEVAIEAGKDWAKMESIKI